MDSQPIPRQRRDTALLERGVFPSPMAARPAGVARRGHARSTASRLADYRRTVASRFDEHRRVEVTVDLIVCTCGGRWPCRVERLAARLLDWM
jgi:hypothetical protein